jgi:streptomycin 3"-adenylyltransferase
VDPVVERPRSEDLDRYLSAVASGLSDVLAGNLVGVYVHGSAAGDDYVEGHSDLDLMVVVRDRLDLATKSALTRLLWDMGKSGPAKGTEVWVVDERTTRSGGSAQGYELYLSTHPDEPATRDGSEAGGPILELAAMPEVSYPVIGPDAGEVIAPIGRGQVLEAMTEFTRGAVAEGPESYAVLTAARSVAFAMTGHPFSKSGGARWAQTAGLGSQILERALEVRQGRLPDRPVTREGRRYVNRLIGMLKSS